MTYWSAILLGIIQGLAEFLPISSSGHLAILQNFLRIGDLENQMLFDVLLHLGTLGAVILAYHTELRGLCREGLAMLHIKKLRRGVKPDLPRRRLLLFLIAATLPLIPAALLNDWLDPLFYNTFFIGFALIVTGFLLLAADRFGHGNKTEKAMTLSDAMVIGLAQMIAVVPGLSRSGTTISAGLLRGFDRTFAVRFSFFLSIPAVLGANLLRLRPAIEVTDGKMHVCKKYRGTFEACVKAYIADRLQGKEDLNLRRVFITHSGVPEEIIETAKEAVRQYQNFEEICVTRAGCTVSSHCGPGTIGVLFLHEG